MATEQGGGTDVLLEACKHGGEQHVNLALRACKDVNRLGSSECTALHLAVWRNHAGIVSNLLAAGAKPDVQDGESGWSALHKAMYWGHLRIATLLLKANASLDTTDHKGRTPLDLLSKELKPYMRHDPASLLSGNATEDAADNSTAVYCWGSGVNYQLGTGSTDFTLHPVRVETLGALHAVALAAAKYHSAAVGADGRLWTWGWGRGGRTGHPEFIIHSGEAALIHPWPVAGLGKRQVVSVSAGKHHMLVATSAGEVWSWGNGRCGRLGYGEVDTQPTPRRVAGLQKVRVIAVAAAHKHSAAITSSGDLYTWGANGSGQLGYGTSDSVFNPSPRLVDALRGKKLVAVCCAKRHTVVLTADGEPYTFGYQMVTPRRVNLAGVRDIARESITAAGTGNTQPEPLKFHRGHAEVARPVAVAVAAGFTHTSILTRTGTVLVWWSADPSLRVQEVQGALSGLRVTRISASKTRTACVTDQGDLYIWEAKEHVKKHTAGETATAGSSLAAAQGNSSELYSSSPQHSTVHGRNEASAGGFTGPFSPGTAYPGGSSYGNSNAGMALAGAALNRRGNLNSKGQLGPAGSNAYSMSAIVPVRVQGVKRVTDVCVGEKHTMVLSKWSVPSMPDEHGRTVDTQHSVRANDLQTHNGDNFTSDYGMEQDNDDDDDDGLADLLDEEDNQSSRDHVSFSAFNSQQPGDDRTAFSSHVGTSIHTGLPGTGYAVHGSYGNGWEQNSTETSAVPSLQVIAQRVVAKDLVEPRTALQILEWADAAGAALLRTYCIAVVLQNLDLIFLESNAALLALPPHLVVELEQHYRAWLQPAGLPNKTTNPAAGQLPQQASVPDVVGSTPPLGSSPISGSWIERAHGLAGSSSNAQSSVQLSVRRQHQLSKLQAPRRPTSVPPALDGGNTDLQPHLSTNLVHATHVALAAIGHAHADAANTATVGDISTRGSIADAGKTDEPFQPNGQEGVARENAAAARLARNIAKKLQQIAALEERAATEKLDAQQLAKISQKTSLLDALHALESGATVDDVQQLLNYAQTLAAKLAAAMDTPTASPMMQQKASTSVGTSSAGSSKAKKQGSVGTPEPMKRSQSKGDVTGEAPGSTNAKQVVNEDSSKTPEIGRHTSSPAVISDTKLSSTPTTAGRSTSTTASGGKDIKAAPRKGGLSMFLSGALDAVASPPVTSSPLPPVPKGPAWGGMSTPAPSAIPLRELLEKSPSVSRGSTSQPSPATPATQTVKQQSYIEKSVASSNAGASSASITPGKGQATPTSASKRGKDAQGTQMGPGADPALPSTATKSSQKEVANAASPAVTSANSRTLHAESPSQPSPSQPASNSAGVRVSLAEFMARSSASTPIIVPTAARDPNTPAWGTGPASKQSSVTSVNVPASTLRDIQAEQERQRKAPSYKKAGNDANKQSSTTKASGGAATQSIVLGGSSPPTSKWYVPEAHTPQAMQAIQTEEAAIREIAKLYGGKVAVSRGKQN